MKKLINCILICMLTLACFSTFAACGKGPAADLNITLCDFEQWGPDFQLCRISNNFGRVSLNTDKAFVKTGSQSARLDPLGAGWMYFPTQSDLFDYDYSDFSYVESVRIEIFNAQKENKTMRGGFVSKIYDVSTIGRICESSYTLKPGWNTVNFLVDAATISIAGDIESVQGVYFMFDDTGTLYISDTTPRYYIDTVRIIKKDSPHNATALTLEFSENEVMDFERFYQEYFLINDYGITLEVVKAADYGIDATSGSKVLHLNIPGKNSGAWYKYVKIPASFIAAGALGKLTDEQYENGYFCFDTYNKHTEAYNVVATFFAGTATQMGIQFGDSQIGAPQPGRWTTHSIKLTDLPADWRENPGMIAFDIKDGATVDRELFFDNLRVEIR